MPRHAIEQDELLRRPIWPSVLVLLGLQFVVGSVILLQSRRIWFFSEDLYFALDRTLGPGGRKALSNLFAPNSEHLSAIPVTVFQAMHGLFGLQHYWVYMVPVVLYHVACYLSALSGVWIVGGFFRGVSVIVLLGLYGPGFINMTWAFQFGMVGSVLWGLLALRSALHSSPTPTRLLLEALMLGIGLLHSSTAAFFLVAVLALRITEARADRRALARVCGVFVLPVLFYCLWLFHYRTTIARVVPKLKPAEAVWTSPTALLDGVGATAAAVAGVTAEARFPIAPTLGVAAVGLLIAGGLRHRHTTGGRDGLILIGIIAAAIVGTNYSRRVLLGGSPLTGHYIYTWSVLLVLAAWCIIPEVDWGGMRGVGRWAAVVGIAIAGAANSAWFVVQADARGDAFDVQFCAIGFALIDRTAATPVPVPIEEFLNYPPVKDLDWFADGVRRGEIDDARLVRPLESCPTSGG